MNASSRFRWDAIVRKLVENTMPTGRRRTLRLALLGRGAPGYRNGGAGPQMAGRWRY